MTCSSHDANGPASGLVPPVTPRPGYPPRADHNYDWQVPDVEVDRRAREKGHGHVTPRPDGRKAKCGGVPTMCGVCRREQEILDWAEGR